MKLADPEVVMELQRLRQYLKAIVSLGGNLPDDRLTDATGPNDAAARGLMYVTARQLATMALNPKVNRG